MIKELEGKIHQLTSEVETHIVAKNLLEREKADLEYQVEKQTSDITELQSRYVWHTYLSFKLLEPNTAVWFQWFETS